MTHPHVNDVTFSAPGWQEVHADDMQRIWTDSFGDQIMVICFALKPDIPAPLDDLETIWKSTRIQSFERQAAPISVATHEIDGIRALETITRFHRYPGDQYQVSTILPFRDFSYVMRVLCLGTEAQDTRRKTILSEFNGPRDTWYEDPFGLPLIAPIGRDRSDDPKWDTRFPGHPLSRARRHAALLRRIVTLPDDVKQAPKFLNPTVRLNPAYIEAFLSVFAVSAQERLSAQDYAAELTARIETVLSRCRAPQDIATLMMPNTDFAGMTALREEVRTHLDLVPDKKLCLLLYSGHVDASMMMSMKAMFSFYAQRDKDPSELYHAEDLASQNFRHWEFFFSRQMAQMEFRSVAIRRDDNPYQDFGIGLIEANRDDWLAKMVVLAEIAEIIFSANFFLNENIARELTYAFSTPELKKKLIMRMSRGQFVLADQQEIPWSEKQLIELVMYTIARNMGLPIQLRRMGTDDPVRPPQE